MVLEYGIGKNLRRMCMHTHLRYCRCWLVPGGPLRSPRTVLRHVDPISSGGVGLLPLPNPTAV